MHKFKNKEISNKILDNKKLDENDKNYIFDEIFNKARFNFKINDILTTMAKCFCAKDNNEMRKKIGVRKHLLFNRGT
jgi:hypothetical protein